MKKIAPAMVLLLLLLPLFFCVPIDASDDQSLLITAAIPTGSFEGVTITNYGQTVDLMDYHLSDGEGTVRFTSSVILESGESISVLKAEPDEWARIGRYVTHSDEYVTVKSFILNDSGDDIYLMRGDHIVDAFVYGNKTSSDGWSGDSFQKVPKYNIALRNSSADTNTSSDWRMTVPGRTELTPLIDAYDSIVTPFVFPDSCGDPIFDAMEKAENNVSISIYTLSHPKIVSLLMSLISSGVTVNILAEGAPAGGVPDLEISGFATLQRAGADIRFIISDDGFKRYTYLHNKYAVIDDDTVVITSENWVESSFTGNRGWGAIIESQEYASYMRSIFENDFTYDSSDISGFREAYPTALSGTYSKYRDSGMCDYTSYNAFVRPCISPDDTYSMMRELISSAEERVYSEQLDVQYSWLTDTDNPVTWIIDAGLRGADSRLIVDVTFDDPNDSVVEDGYGVLTALEDVEGIAVKTADSGRLTHNKGVIADDAVWLGSVNWTYNSFMNNRETAVIIESSEIADYYTSYYLSDWGSKYVGEVVLDVAVNSTQKDSKPFLIDASGTVTSDGSEFSWDIDSDGIADRWGEEIVLSLPLGVHKITLTVTEINGTEHRMDVDIKVGLNDSADNMKGVWKYVPLLVICIIVLGLKYIRGSGGRKNSDKRVQSGRRR